jgi:hypothetical protein
MKAEAIHTVLFVPNDAEGQAFLAQMKKYLNRKQYRVRLRGRNPDRKSVATQRQNVRQSIRNDQATYFGVYIDGKHTEKITKDYYDRLLGRAGHAYAQEQEATRLRQTIINLTDALDLQEREAARQQAEQPPVNFHLKPKRKFRKELEI